MINVVGSRELDVTISDKIVKIGSLLWGEGEGSFAKVVESYKDVSQREREQERPSTGIARLERADEFTQHEEGEE